MKTININLSLFKNITRQAITIALGSAIFISSCKKDNNDTPAPSPNQTDIDFTRKATLANKAEIELGKVAVSNAMHDSVKAFGNLMIKEHQDAFNKLFILAGQKKITIDTSLDAEHIAMKLKLSTMSGHAFDSAYIASQITDQQKTQAEFQTEINSGLDQDIKNYAIEIIHHVMMHLDKANKIKDSIQ